MGFCQNFVSEKTKTKFPAMKKNVLLGYLPNESFQILCVCVCQACVFQYKSSKRKNCNKRLCFFQSDIL